MIDLSLLTSIIINIVGIGIIFIIDYIDLRNKKIEEYRKSIGYLLFGLFIISLCILTKEIITNIIHFNTTKSFNIKTIISIFISNILTFALCYYSLYLINEDNFYIETNEFNGYEENEENRHIFNLYSYMNTLIFTFFTTFAATIRELDYKSLISKFFGVLQIVYSVIIGAFFIDKVVDIDIMNINKK
jgi:hypothetical protein